MQAKKATIYIKKVLSFLLCFAFVISSIGCASTEKLIEKANTAFSESKWDEAIELSEKILDKSETSEAISFATDMIQKCNAKINLEKLKDYIAKKGVISGHQRELSMSVSGNKISFNFYEYDYPTDGMVFRIDCGGSYDINGETLNFNFERTLGMVGTSWSGDDSMKGSIQLSTYKYGDNVEVISHTKPNKKDVFGSLLSSNIGGAAADMLSHILREISKEYVSPAGLTMSDIGFTALK